MIKYLNKGDYVKIDHRENFYQGYRGHGVSVPLSYNIDLGKVQNITLTEDNGHLCGMEVPSVAYNTKEASFQSSFELKYTTGSLSKVYTMRARSEALILLTEEEEKDLGIYFSGDYDKYPLIINNPYLKEAVRERLKHHTKPDPNGTYL